MHYLVMRRTFIFITLIYALQPTFASTPCGKSLTNVPLEASPGLKVSELSLEDTEKAQELDKAVWGDEMAATTQKMISRIESFPEGQFKLEKGDQLLGVLNTQRIESTRLEILSQEGFYNAEGAWSYFTDSGWIKNSHDIAGDALFMINISTAIPDSLSLTGLGRSDIGEALIMKLIDHAKRKRINKIFGITRVNGFRKYLGDEEPDKSAIHNYLKRVKQKEIRDPALSFHLRMGAKIISSVENAMPEDSDSYSYGALIVYELDR